MKLVVHDIIPNTFKTVETPFTLRQWVLINFAGWGWFKIVTDGKKYLIYNTFENNALEYEVSKGALKNGI